MLYNINEFVEFVKDNDILYGNITAVHEGYYEVKCINGPIWCVDKNLILRKYTPEVKPSMYPVFKVDTYFGTYGCEYDFIAAKSKEDLIEHLDSIYQDDFEYEITEEDVEYGDNVINGVEYKVGDVIKEPMFNEEQMTELKNSDFRINKVEGMFSDKPYEILDGFSYYE